MTVREVLGVLVRRWYVLLAVLGVAALVAVGLLRDGGIYTTRTVVAFTLPATTTLTFSNGLDDANVIAFAGAVAQEVNNGRPPARYSTDEAPLYGAGLREGVLVSLPNAGNQWVSSFLRAEVELQVVGRTREWVEEQQTALVDRVLVAAEQQQVVAAIPPESRIAASVVPLTRQIEFVGPSRSTELIAVAAIGVAGLIVGCWLSVAADRGLRRHARRRGAGPRRRSLSVPSGTTTVLGGSRT